MSFDINELKKMYNGDREERIKYLVPNLSHNGQEGRFYFSSADYNNKKEIETPTVIFLAERIKYSAMFKVGDKKVMQFTTEVKDYNSQFTVFEKIDDKIKLLGKGNFEAIKKDFPLLRGSLICYCLYNGEVHKIEIKGSSRAFFSSYKKELSGEGLSPFQVNTKITSMKQIGDLGAYYSMNFDKGEPTDLELVGPKIKEINEIFKKIDDQAAKIDASYNEKSTGLSQQEEKSIQVDEVVEDTGASSEIDSIPF